MELSSAIRRLLPRSVKKHIRSFTKRQQLVDKVAPALPEILCIDVGASYFPHGNWRLLLSSPNTRWIAVDPNGKNLGYAKNWEWPCRLEILPVGLSRMGGKMDLYITNVDSGSSLLPPIVKPSMTHRVANLDYFFPVRKVCIDTRSLNEIIATAGGAMPILIKLDTQGTELSILEGAREVFARSRIVGVELESTMLAEPIMEGSGRFWQAAEFFESLGFELLHIKPIYSQSPTKGKRQKGNTWLNECDATFSLRRDVAAKLGVDFRVALFAFYVTYFFFEEAHALISDDPEVAQHFGEHQCSPDTIKALLVLLM